MSDALKVAKHYFELSNKSNFSVIEKLFTDSTMYSSPTTGVYLGRADIMAMQKAFHGKFSDLNWKVISAEEVKPGVILFDYEFTGVMIDGEKVKSSGLEFVTVHNGKIQNIKIRNKSRA